MLLPDGRVLIGGHAPITTLYLKHINAARRLRAQRGRDPSFEIYSPPYLFRGARPQIVSGTGRARLRPHDRRGRGRPARDIESVVLVRNPTETHWWTATSATSCCGSSRAAATGSTVATPPNGNVAPPGPYMLFVNRKTADGTGALGRQAAHAALTPVRRGS